MDMTPAKAQSLIEELGHIYAVALAENVDTTSTPLPQSSMVWLLTSCSS
jgi:hypothetical protein